MAQLGGVAFWAHIGGFVFGMLFGPLLRQRERLPVRVRGDWERW
jgi:membrane associated rhomboid family serine protease